MMAVIHICDLCRRKLSSIPQGAYTVRIESSDSECAEYELCESCVKSVQKHMTHRILEECPGRLCPNCSSRVEGE